MKLKNLKNLISKNIRWGITPSLNINLPTGGYKAKTNYVGDYQSMDAINQAFDIPLKNKLTATHVIRKSENYTEISFITGFCNGLLSTSSMFPWKEMGDFFVDVFEIVTDEDINIGDLIYRYEDSKLIESTVPFKKDNYLTYGLIVKVRKIEEIKHHIPKEKLLLIKT